MPSIVKRNGGRPAAQSGEWDPFRMMENLLRWEPSQRLIFAADEHAPGFLPQFDVKETSEGYVFKADLPGVKESDLDIQLSGNMLTISGRRAEEQRDAGDTWFAYERSHGSFARTFALPEGAASDQARADLKDGVMTLVLPKRPEVQPKKIQVRSNNDDPKAKS